MYDSIELFLLAYKNEDVDLRKKISYKSRLEKEARESKNVKACQRSKVNEK